MKAQEPNRYYKFKKFPMMNTSIFDLFTQLVMRVSASPLHAVGCAQGPGRVDSGAKPLKSSLGMEGEKKKTPKGVTLTGTGNSTHGVGEDAPGCARLIGWVKSSVGASNE
ncbi:MAG TPA: hypothetical protein VJ952_07095, partial [Opitutales bacterium]|nr:hypothetical protein [Opitutales bacterium]